MFKMGLYPQAQECFTHLNNDNVHQCPDIVLEVGEAHMRMQNWKDADTALRMLLDNDEYNAAYVWLDLARCALCSGNYEMAIAWAKGVREFLQQPQGELAGMNAAEAEWIAKEAHRAEEAVKQGQAPPMLPIMPWQADVQERPVPQQPPTARQVFGGGQRLQRQPAQAHGGLRFIEHVPVSSGSRNDSGMIIHMYNPPARRGGRGAMQMQLSSFEVRTRRALS